MFRDSPPNAKGIGFSPPLMALPRGLFFCPFVAEGDEEVGEQGDVTLEN